MTISGTATSITVDGDGLTSVFNYDFYMGGSSAYAVLVYIDTNGDETTIQSTDFSITGVTSQSGGTFTYPLVGSPIAVGTQLRLSRVLPLVQNAAIGNQGNFYPSVVEGGLDYLTMIAQQLSGASGTLDAQSLFGNSGSSAAVGGSIPIGSGLSFSGNTLVVSGISGSGTVTQINTGSGLSGGPITGVGTVTLSTITTGHIMGNFDGSGAAPHGLQLVAGSGITFSGSATALTITASGGTAALVRITETTTTGSQTSVTFSSITTSYRDLEIRIRGRGTQATTEVFVNLQFNGDTGSNYSSVIGVFNGSGGSSTQNLATTSITRIFDLPAASATTGYCGNSVICIGDYKGTTFFKSAYGVASAPRNPASTGLLADMGGGIWTSTSAITSVTVFLSAGGFVDNSVVSLYGVL